MKRKVLMTMRADRLAIELGRVTESSHVSIVIKPRGWWHNLSFHTLYAREWAGVIK